MTAHLLFCFTEQIQFLHHTDQIFNFSVGTSLSKPKQTQLQPKFKRQKKQKIEMGDSKVPQQKLKEAIWGQRAQPKYSQKSKPTTKEKMREEATTWHVYNMH